MKKEDILKLFEKEPFVFQRFPWKYATNKKFIKEAFVIDSRALDYASPDLKKDKEFVLELINETPWVIQYADDTLKNDKQVALAAVKSNGQTLIYVGKNLKNDNKKC